jgi:fumarate hydratase subunit beta
MDKLKLPVDRTQLCNLKPGQWVALSGPMLVARDQAHLRLINSINKGEKLPVELKDETILYAGPIVKDGRIVIGPTSSTRMDGLTEPLLKKGLAVTIGKGSRGKDFGDILEKYKSVYLMTFGGAAAFLSQYVRKAKIIAYGDLGPEALYRIEVEDFPALTAIDCRGEKYLG